MIGDTHFPAMGSDVRVRVHATTAKEATRLCVAARRQVEELELRWSRFVASSEIRTISERAGRWVRVSDATMTLLERSLAMWQLTNGAFDITVGMAMDSLGYRQPFRLLTASEVETFPSPPSPGADSIDLDHSRRRVRVPPSTLLDVGGIAKGYAADLVADRLCDSGARGAGVSVGGDLRVRSNGDAPPMLVRLAHPDGGPDLAQVALSNGAVAASSRCRRTWRGSRGVMHHIVDPERGEPTDGPLGVTVVDTECWRAEALATAAMVRPAEVARLDLGVTGFIVDATGRPRALDRSADPAAR